MPLFGRPAYPGAYPGGMPRIGLFRILLLILGLILGFYVLNSVFLWVAIPAMGTSVLKALKVFSGAVIILLSIAVVLRPRMY